MAVQIPFPLPATGYALNSKVRVNLDFLVDKFNEFNSGTATWDNVSIGTANSLTGTLTLYNASNANYLTIKAGATSPSYTLTLPTALPSGEGLLKSTSAGVMSFFEGTGIPYESSGTFGFSGAASQAKSLVMIGTGGVPVLADHSYNITAASNGLLYIASGVSVDALANALGSTAVVAISTGGTPAARTLAGTSNQITVTPTGTTFTFSTPQDIGTASSVQFSRVKVDAGSYSSPGFYFDSSTSNTVGLFAEANGTGLNVRAGASGGSTVFSIDSTGLAVATGELRAPTVRGTSNLKVSTGASSITTIASGATSDWTLTLPVDGGTSGYVLRTNGSGTTSWVSVSAAGGATTALDNLASVAINTTLVSDTNNTDDLGTSSIRWKTGYFATSVDISATTNQIILGTTNRVTLSSTAPTASRVYTIPDAGGDTTFILSGGNQTVTGNKTFSGTVNMTSLTASLPLQLDSSKNIVSTAIDLSGSQVTGNLGVSHLNSGTSASSTTFWCGDGTWKSISGGGGATKALDNLASTAVNASIIPASNATNADLGSSTKLFTNIWGGTINAGQSGFQGTFVLYPATASKGSTLIQMADNSGNTNTTVSFAAQAGARTYTVPDAGASASFVMTEGTQTINGSKTMGSSLAMGSNKITGLAAATANGDAIRYEQVNGQRVIQIVTATTATSASRSSSTYADSNLTASITPTSSSSKILVVVHQAVSVDTAGSTLGLQLLRDSSIIFGPRPYMYGSAAFALGTGSITYLDSPASTSALTYKTQYASMSGSGTVHVQDSFGGTNGMSTITLFEIG